VAVRGPHQCDVAPDPVESDRAVRPEAFGLPLSFQLHAELSEERDSRVQVVDDDADVVHPLNSHPSEHKERGERMRYRPFTGQAWMRFVQAIKHGEFEL
jgi:hypothetical protein